MIDTGGPALPSHGSMGEVTHEGMTLRDWFAGQALVGIAGQSKDFTDALVRKARERGMESEPYAAEMAYALADAMIAERNEP